MTKIPDSATLRRGAQVLAEIFPEIDRQIGPELGTEDGVADGEETARFLAERGGAVKSAGAAVSTAKAYSRRSFQRDAVSREDMETLLGRGRRSLAAARKRGEPLEDQPKTWRALARFSLELESSPATAQEIVADRKSIKTVDLDVVRRGVRLTSGILQRIERELGDGDGTLKAATLEKFMAGYQGTVATAKPALRHMLRDLKNRYGKEEFTVREINMALYHTMKGIAETAKRPGAERYLARWSSVVAFAEEAAAREKSPRDIVADFAAPGIEPAGPRARALDEWKALDEEIKHEVLEDYGNRYDHYLASGEKRLEGFEGADRTFAEKLVRALLDEVGEVEDHYGTIGEPSARIELVKLPSGELVGGRVRLFQQGFDPEEERDVEDDEYYSHFRTAAEASAAGFDPDQDISWQVSGFYDHDAKPLADGRYNDGYWEWSGW